MLPEVDLQPKKKKKIYSWPSPLRLALAASIYCTGKQPRVAYILLTTDMLKLHGTKMQHMQRGLGTHAYTVPTTSVHNLQNKPSGSLVIRVSCSLWCALRRHTFVP